MSSARAADSDALLVSAPEATGGGPAPADGAASSHVAVIGLGNPILGDDGAGWRVIEVLQRLVDGGMRLPETATLDRLAVGGLALMERLVGLDRAILVDAVRTGAAPVGTVTVQPLDALSPRISGHLDSAHDTTLHAAIVAGRALGADLPWRIDVVGIEIADDDTFGAELSPAVENGAEVAADRVWQLLAADADRDAELARRMR